MQILVSIAIIVVTSECIRAVCNSKCSSMGMSHLIGSVVLWWHITSGNKATCQSLQPPLLSQYGGNIESNRIMLYYAITTNTADRSTIFLEREFFIFFNSFFKGGVAWLIFAVEFILSLKLSVIRQIITIWNLHFI